MLTVYHIIVYTILIFLIVISNANKQKTIFWVLICIIVLISGIRDVNNYSDLPEYLTYYQTGEVETVSGDNINIGFELLNKLLYSMGVPFQFFLFCIGITVFFLYGHIIDKYSPNRLLSLLLFILTAYIMFLAALRQSLACAIGMLAFEAIIKRKMLMFLVCVFIASLFHTTALVILPVYYIYGVKINKKNICVLFGCFLTVIVLFNIVGGYLVSFSEYYAQYLQYDNEGSITRSLMKIYICGLFIYVLRKKIFDKDSSNYLLLLCMFINVMLYLGGSQIYGMARLRMFFEISEIIGIPVIWLYAKEMKRKKKIIVNYALALYVILLFISYNNLLSSDQIITDTIHYKTIFGTL